MGEMQCYCYDNLKLSGKFIKTNILYSTLSLNTELLISAEIFTFEDLHQSTCFVDLNSPCMFISMTLYEKY